MNRRKYMVAIGGMTLLAGCTTGEGGEEDDDSGDSGDEPEELEPDANDEPNNEDRSDADSLLTISSPAELDELPFDSNIVAELEGEGNSVTDPFELDGSLTMLVYEAEVVDEESFGADIEQTDGDDSMVLAINEVVFFDDPVDEITGGSLVETQGGEYILDVEAAGEWTIYVAQPDSPGQEVRTPPVSVEGEDSAIVGPIDADSGLTVAGEHQDEDREYSFDVRVVSEDATDFLDGDFAFTEDAGFAGEARVDVDGVSWAAVRTFGPWSLEFDD